MGALEAIGKTTGSIAKGFGRAGKGFLTGAGQYLRGDLEKAQLLRDIEMIKEAGGPNSEAGRQLLSKASQKYTGRTFAPEQFKGEMSASEQADLEARKAYYNRLRAQPGVGLEIQRIGKAIADLALVPGNEARIGLLQKRLDDLLGKTGGGSANNAGPARQAPRQAPRHNWSQGLDLGPQYETEFAGVSSPPPAPARPIPFTPPFGGGYAVPQRPAAPSPQRHIAATPAGTPQDAGPSTYDEFKMRVKSLAATDKGKAQQYYNQWARKFENASR